MRYIPPYCWHLSPLDNGAFGALVLYLRRRYDWVQQRCMEEALEAGMRNCSRESARRYFRNCRYI